MKIEIWFRNRFENNSMDSFRVPHTNVRATNAFYYYYYFMLIYIILFAYICVRLWVCVSVHKCLCQWLNEAVFFYLIFIYLFTFEYSIKWNKIDTFLRKYMMSHASYIFSKICQIIFNALIVLIKTKCTVYI